MNEEAAAGRRQSDPRTVARRVREERTRLGLTEQEVATRAGMSPRYLQHLLDAGPDFDPGGFLRIAAALGLTHQELLEGRDDPPPGQAGPGARPVLARLSVPECWDRLGTHGVGHIALPGEPGPAVFPVNYAVDAGTIVYRTAPHGAAAPEPGAAVSFEADLIDNRFRRGWSVLVTGTAERIEDPATVRRLAEGRFAEPWAGGDRPTWIRIRPRNVTGRRIEAMRGGSPPLNPDC